MNLFESKTFLWLMFIIRKAQQEKSQLLRESILKIIQMIIMPILALTNQQLIILLIYFYFLISGKLYRDFKIMYNIEKYLCNLLKVKT